MRLQFFRLSAWGVCMASGGPRRTDRGRARVFYCGKVPLPSLSVLASGLALCLDRPQLSSFWRGGRERERAERRNGGQQNQNWLEGRKEPALCLHSFVAASVSRPLALSQSADRARRGGRPTPFSNRWNTAASEAQSEHIRGQYMFTVP